MAAKSRSIDVFISYKREERPKAEALAKRLVKEGYSVWWDVELLPGDRFHDAILEVIKKAKAAIVLWSKAAVASDFVRDEASRAKARGILIPIQLEECEIPLGFNTVQTLDLSNWNTDPLDPLLDPIIEAIRRKAEPSGKATGDEPIIAKNVASEEASQWRKVAANPNASARDYREYLNRYGNAALFAELAKLQIAALKRDEEQSKKGPGLQGRIAIAGGIVATIGGIVGIGLNFSIIVQKLGLSEPPVEPLPFSEASVCVGDWIFREREICPDPSKPRYAVVTDGELCGYEERSKTIQPVGFKQCRHIEHGVERYADSDVVKGNSGWMGGGHSQPEWCQRMKDRYQTARPSIPITWTKQNSSESSKKDWQGHVEYNYHCTATANWNPIYKLASTEACAPLDVVTEVEKVARSCEDKTNVASYDRSQNSSCEWAALWTLAEGARVKDVFGGYSSKLADLPLCATCDEYAANAEQRGTCLAERRARIVSGEFASASDGARLAEQMKSVAKQLLESDRPLTSKTRQQLADF